MATTFDVHQGDTRTGVTARLQQPDSSGTLQDVDLTGKTVEFKMVDQDGVVSIALNDVGITIVDAATGQVSYDFQTGETDTPGRYYAYFVVTEAGQPDTFPVERGDLIVEIHGDAAA